LPIMDSLESKNFFETLGVFVEVKGGEVLRLNSKFIFPRKVTVLVMKISKDHHKNLSM